MTIKPNPINSEPMSLRVRLTALAATAALSATTLTLAILG